MKKLTIFISCLTLIALLSGCSPVYKTQYQFSAPTTDEGKVCANNCLDKLQSCQNACKVQEAECRHIETLKGENAYLRYVNERQAKGEHVDKSVTHFQNFSKCKNNCQTECKNHHRICHVNCGGYVTESEVCVAFCD